MRLNLGFEKIEFRQTFLFQHLFGLALYAEIFQCDPEYETHQIYKKAAREKIKDLLPVKYFGLQRKEPVIDDITQPGTEKGDGDDARCRGDDVTPCLPSLVQSRKDAGDIAVNNDGIKKGIQRCVSDRLTESFPGDISKKIEQEYKSPDQELELNGRRLT